jgi:hypothetical protein
MQKWEVNFQGRPPTAFGDLGDLDENVGFCVFLQELASPNPYAVWQNEGGTMQQDCLRCASLAAWFWVRDEMI